MSQMFQLPKPLAIDSNLLLMSGAKAFFYQTGTTTPQNTYQDADLNTPHTNPVVADSAGKFPPIWFNSALPRYKLILKTSADVTVYTVDPVNQFLFSQAELGAIFYPRTAAEIAAGVTPTNYAYEPRPWIDVKRQGCVLDGSTDDYAAFNRCLSVASTANTGLIIDGPMLIGTNITVPKNVALWFVGNGKIKPAASRTVTLNCRILAGHQQIFDISNSSALIAGQPVVDFASVCWFGAVGDDSTDDTVAIQRVHDFCKTYRIPVKWPTATFLVTDSILLYSGCNSHGTHRTQYTDGFSSTPAGTTIHFTPASTKDLFDFQNNGSEFLYHISLGGFFFKGDGAVNAQYCIDCDGVIYGHFFDMAANSGGWKAAVRLNRTINNRFTNLYCSGTVQSIRYSGGSATTDVWEQCSFWASPIGVNMVGTCIGIRFSKCLFEQLDDYGAYIIKDCQNIEFDHCYSEDVPYTNNAAGAMFKFGHDGTTLVTENGIIIIGGTYQGRNAGTVGSFFDSDYLNGAMIGSVNVSRFTNVIKSSANTRNKSVILSGFAGIGFTNVLADATTLDKVAGFYPNGVINSGSNDQIARFADMTVSGTMTSSSAVISGLSDYADDAAAAIGGIVVGQLYRTVSAVKVRVS